MRRRNTQCKLLCPLAFSTVPFVFIAVARKYQDDTSHRLGLWAPGLNPSDPGVPGFVSLDSPFLSSDVANSIANICPDSNMVVYAGPLKAFCAVQGLIDLGVAPEKIIVVRPISPGAVAAAARKAPSSGSSSSMPWSLGDTTIDTAAAAAVFGTGVVDGGERLLESVRLSTEGGVAAAVFANTEGGDGVKGESKEGNRHQAKPTSPESADEFKGVGGSNDDSAEEEQARCTIACGLLLCGDTPNADPDVFRAANNSGLVYDGRLVVDPMFRTSDPAILAGGRLTKFSRVHGAGAPRHEQYNAREVIYVKLPDRRPLTQHWGSLGFFVLRPTRCFNPFGPATAFGSCVYCDSQSKHWVTF